MRPEGTAGRRRLGKRQRIESSDSLVPTAGLPALRRDRRQQLQPALALRPDLATLFTGTKDVIAPRFDADEIGSHVEFMQRKLVENGATVIGFTLADLSIVLPLTRLIAGRVRVEPCARSRVNECIEGMVSPGEPTAPMKRR